MIPQNRAVIRQMEITQQASLSLNSQLWVLPTNHDYAKPAYHDMPWASSFSSPTQLVKNIFLRKGQPEHKKAFGGTNQKKIIFNM